VSRSFLPIFCFLLSGGFAERPGAVKGAFCAAQRTLDGSGPLCHHAGKKKTKKPTNEARCRSTTVATLPSALLVSDFRPVQVGCSRFSRCCHLFSDLSSQ